MKPGSRGLAVGFGPAGCRSTMDSGAPSRRGKWLPVCLGGVVCTLARPASAEPGPQLEITGYQRANPATELLVVRTEGSSDSRVSAEALAWAGARERLRAEPAPAGSGAFDRAPEALQGDLLIADVRIRDSERRGELELGRFVASLGALRPVHIDGVSGLLRVPGDFRVAAFGGVLVVPRFEGHSYDWVAGGRLSRAIGDWGSAGIAYGYRRDHGELSGQQVGLDAGAAVGDWLDLAGLLAYDLISPGVSEARATALAHHADWRTGLFYTERSPFRLLPATSLFSVLGDFPAHLTGVSFDYRLAPRLDLASAAAARWIGGEFGESLRLGLVLRLDDRGNGSVGIEGRREAAPDGNWTGIRPVARVPLLDTLWATTELELVVPDHPGERGRFWPWGRLSIGWMPAEHWEVACGVEASASPRDRRRTDALLRLTRRFGGGA